MKLAFSFCAKRRHLTPKRSSAQYRYPGVSIVKIFLSGLLILLQIQLEDYLALSPTTFSPMEYGGRRFGMLGRTWFASKRSRGMGEQGVMVIQNVSWQHGCRESTRFKFSWEKHGEYPHASSLRVIRQHQLGHQAHRRCHDAAGDVQWKI